MTSTRGLGSTTSYTGGSARWEGLEDRQKTVSVRDLPQESQAAHEILKELKVQDPKGRSIVMEHAQVKEPLGQKGLAAVADLFFRLDMPLTTVGIARFKAERGLGSGPNLAGPVARAYARAVVGGEVLFRVDKNEEMNLRPADKACLTFLRTWSRSPGVAEVLGRLKEALDLGNPDVSADAVRLANEYVGAQTVREVSKASSTKNCPLTPEGMRTLAELVEADKAKAAAKPAAKGAKPAASPVTSPATSPTTPPRTPASNPTTTPTTLPPKFAGSLPGARMPTLPPRGSTEPVTTPTLQRPPPTQPAADPTTTPMRPPRPAADPTTTPVTSTGLRKR